MGKEGTQGSQALAVGMWDFTPSLQPQSHTPGATQVAHTELSGVFLLLRARWRRKKRQNLERIFMSLFESTHR